MLKVFPNVSVDPHEVEAIATIEHRIPQTPQPTKEQLEGKKPMPKPLPDKIVYKVHVVMKTGRNYLEDYKSMEEAQKAADEIETKVTEAKKEWAKSLA